jgi:hypothetical protein
MNPLIARKLHNLVHNPEAWEPLEEYLLEQIQWTHQALGVETSELVFRQLQGKLASLELIKNLKDVVKSTIANDDILRKQDKNNEY